MTPAARIAAAIEILDDVLAGASAEKCLTGWARRSRFAGSKDRAAIRDLVFDALRRRRSLAWTGGGETGRGLMIGRLRAAGEATEDMFTGDGHAPGALTGEEAAAGASIEGAPDAVRWDCPDWLLPEMQAALGDRAGDVLTLMQARAPVFLRVNLGKISVERAIAHLADDSIGVETCPLSATALQVTENPRRVQASRAYLEGEVELQDAASQAVVDLVLPYAEGTRVFDYCAGGGGKALHLAAGGAGDVTAWDADQGRMRDLPVRAERAGAQITIAETPRGTFDCVLTDVPCSGSGAWRRQPEAKWRLTADRLRELNGIQDSILRKAMDHVAPGGVLAYATCSLLRSENDDRVDAFLSDVGGWSELSRRQFTPLDGGDGFFVSILKRSAET